MEHVDPWTLLIALVCGLFLLVVLGGLQSTLASRRLDQGEASPPAGAWPRLSVVIPALNEGHTLEAALTTLLAQTYPNLEIVLINDRSTDDTGAIVDRLAAKDPRIKPLHITELPAGWLGKLHALHRGTELASGEWLLYSDADVHFEPGVLERAVALAEADGLDQLAVLPFIISSSFALTATLISFAVTFMLMVRPHRVGRPGSKVFIGVGAFNLIRRRGFDRTPGFEWLKMEIGDDVGLGKMIVEHGGKAGWRLGGDQLTIVWYEDVASLIRGLEKNTYGIFSRFRPGIFALKLLVIVGLWMAPWTAIVAPPTPWLRGLGVVVLAAITLLHVVIARRLRYSLLAGAAAPWIGAAVLLVALWRSAFTCWRDGGIKWRGTVYSVEDLRRGQRVKL